jgi:rhamnosyltransferase
LERIDMDGNHGVAAAQNAGMRRAFARGASHVLLLDHDSVLRPGATAALLKAWDEQTRAGKQVAAIGANYRDPRRPAVSPFIRIDGWRFKRVVATAPGAAASVSYVISSGSLISQQAFDAVGPMKETFFVDYVDTEWGLRAGRKGWESFGAFDAHLEHALGDESLRILGSAYPFHSPLRHYYMARNAVWLIARTPLPVGTRFVEAWRLLRRFVAYAIFAPNPHLHIVAMLSGLGDGLRGRLGARRGCEGLNRLPSQ